MHTYGRYRIIIAILFIVGDILILNLLFFSMLHAVGLQFDTVYQIICVLINLGYLLSFAAMPLVQQMEMTNLFRRNIYKLTITAFILITSLFFLKIAEPTSRLFILVFFATACLLMTVNQWLTRKALAYSIKEKFNKGIILGAGYLGERIFDEMLGNIYNGVIILGFFDDNPDKDRKDISGNIEDAKEFILKNGVTDVFCTLPGAEEDKINDFIKFSEKHVLNFHIIPDIGCYYSGAQPIATNIGKMPVFLLHHIPLGYAHNAMIKRICDVLISSIALLVLCPTLFPLLAILIRKSSPGPVIFKQKRTGERGKEFTCYKFRTMKCNGAADTRQATADDDRKTRIGDLLRKTSLDELPQLFNVLKGDMSLVGPRPHMLKHTDEYSPKVDKYMVRHFVKPGITGLAQVRGYRGETKDIELMEKRILSDIEYVENWNVGLDSKIILKTALMVLKGDKMAY
ncbi:MAG: undecaprenyl-phosphate glucose phosphotransferase [Bacteroidales bacterium]|jgi:putative colanic acid biosynthesis UDP-glucose lipid carrier transferase|nr:undecaprenyl-phosphate glucose phosphotransferase [Bacteroidales bacterium]